MGRVPAALAVALVGMVVITLVRFGVIAAESQWLVRPHWRLAIIAFGFAYNALMASGAFELARRTTGTASRAAHVAGVLQVVLLGLGLVWIVLDFLQFGRASGLPDVVWEIEGYVWSGLQLGATIALVLAAGGWKRAAVAATLAVVIATYLALPPPVVRVVRESLGIKVAALLDSGVRAVLVVALLALVMRASRELAEPSEDGGACEHGLRRAAAALWLRLVAAAGLIALTLFAVTVRGRGSMAPLQLSLVTAPAINALALALFAGGAFAIARSGVRDVARHVAYVAGALSVWAAAVLAMQLPWLYRVVYRSDDTSGFVGEMATELVGAYAVGVPVVASAGIVVLVIAIAGFARRRNLDELREQASSRALVFVMLMAGSLGIQQGLLPKATSIGAFAMWSLIAAAAGVAGLVLVAKLLQRAADAVHAAPGLPTASVVSS